MPLNNDPPTLDGASLALKAEAVAGKSLVDYGLWGGIVPGNVDRLGELRDGGVVAAKAFMCHSGLDQYPGVDDAALSGALRRCAELGLIVGLHAVTVAVLALGLSGLSVGLGACMPNFRESDPSKIAVGFGGTLNLVACVLFLLVVISLMAAPWHLQAAGERPSGGLPGLSVPLGLGAFAGLVIGLAAAFLPMRVGAQALRQMEF